MKAVLNIGQRIADLTSPAAKQGRRYLTGAQVRLALTAAGFHILRLEFVPSSSESAFVLEVDNGWTYSTTDHAAIENVSQALGQDCIAVTPQREDGGYHAGLLLGPKAEAWRPFNPAYFVWPGSVSAPLKEAA